MPQVPRDLVEGEIGFDEHLVGGFEAQVHQILEWCHTTFALETPQVISRAHCGCGGRIGCRDLIAEILLDPAT